MDRIMNSTLKHIRVRGILLAACVISLALQPFTASAAGGATQIPALWTAGGLSAGTERRNPTALFVLGGSVLFAIMVDPITATGCLALRVPYDR